MNILIVGAGRAGTSFAAALSVTRRVTHRVTLVHHDAVTDFSNAQLVLLCVPDDAIAAFAADLRVGADTVVAHVAGSRGLDVLAPHSRVGSLHPLLTMPDAALGAQRLRGGIFSVEGDALLNDVVDSLEGQIIVVSSELRALYHATAASAANHVVALLGHVQALARAAHLDLADFVPLARQAFDDAVAYGPARALTGPAARGDLATIAAHLRSLPDDERDLYVALSERAMRLAQESETPWSA
ncbi:MAG: DUF2520 domain-containing protein [Acidimicrobiaceae bacterium]|nr:DUF2520 domain-containing protein [Acidimicrobiaceae bacterium]